jgi:outer membrane protein assembly factor BamA
VNLVNNFYPRSLNIKAVPLYFFAYEIPVFLKRDSYNLICGPQISNQGLGFKSSLQKPYEHIFFVSSYFDFSNSQFKATAGFEFKHIANRLMSWGLEAFDYQPAAGEDKLQGAKIYLRQELSPASYGLLGVNDHISLYLLRNRELEKSSILTNAEDIEHLRYFKKAEAIVGLTCTFGRYGPSPDPNYGFRFSCTQEIAGHFLGADTSFWRSSLEVSNYKLLLPQKGAKIATRFKFGWAEPSDKTLFQLGGDDGLRGFARKTVNGAHIIMVNLEYRMKGISGLRFYLFDNLLHLEDIGLVGFFDFGKAWYSDFDDSGFKKDLGLGLRLGVNLGGILEKVILRLDVAQALGESKNKPRLWFGINHSF